MTALSDDEIISLAQKYGFGMDVMPNEYCDEMGFSRGSRYATRNVRTEKFLAFSRALLAAQPAVQQPAEDAELLATVECLTDESGADYVVVLRTNRPKLYGKEHKRESAAQRVADIINSEFGRAAIKAQGGKQ